MATKTVPYDRNFESDNCFLYSPTNLVTSSLTVKKIFDFVRIMQRIMASFLLLKFPTSGRKETLAEIIVLTSKLYNVEEYLLITLKVELKELG